MFIIWRMIRMDFMEAVKAMREGKKVRKESTPNKDFKLYIKNDGVRYTIGNQGYWTPYQFRISDFEATDWEIYEETLEEHKKHCDFCKGINAKEDNWNLADNINTTINITSTKPYMMAHLKDIKTFIQKVKEDIQNLKKVEYEGVAWEQSINEIIDKRAGDL